MKILLLNDLDYLDHRSVDSLNRPEIPPTSQPRSSERETVTDQVKKGKGEELEVERDEMSEAAEHEQGCSWFILSETGNRFKIPDNDFRVLS
jgi:hypothetical protein